MKTKEKILEASLTLFAENGYAGTSMEQIANLVGIKAPSLYKHFKNKEDLLNQLIDTAELRYEKHFRSDRNTGKLPEDLEEFVHILMEKIRFTVYDPLIRNIRIFLVKEQFRSERLAKITSKHQVDGLQKMYGKIIGGMMHAELLEEGDPALMAMQLTAPAVLLVAKADRQPDCVEEVIEKIEIQIRHFCDTYKKK